MNCPRFLVSEGAADDIQIVFQCMVQSSYSDTNCKDIMVMQVLVGYQGRSTDILAGFIAHFMTSTFSVTQAQKPV